MKEHIHGARNHDNFMTEKERVFVENCHRKSISNTLNQKDFSVFFEEQSGGALLITKKEVRTEHKAECSETQRNLFGGGFAKSRKKPRLVSSGLSISLPVEMQAEMRIEEFCILVLKIKYRYNEIVVQEKNGNFAYDPGNASADQIVEYETAAISMLQEHLTRFSKSPKFFSALYDLYTSVNSTLQKSIILSFLNSSGEIESTAPLRDFVDRIFKKIPSINKEEIRRFCSTFHSSITGVVFATALVLNDPGMAKEFKLHLNDEAVRSIFEVEDRKSVWQFFGVTASSLDVHDKRDLVLLVREKLMKAVHLERDRDAIIFLKSIGVEEDDLK